MARDANPDCVVLVDGTQAVPQLPVSFRDLDVDFYALTGHKMCGPTGIGALVAKPERLESMEPFLTGGEMIRDVTLDSVTWNEIPAKFEAGTPMIAEAAGLGRPVDYLTRHRDGPDPRARARAHPALPRPARPGRGRDPPRPDRRDRRGGAISFASTASTRTTSARCSTPRACASGSGTTAPSR
jgi:cysteine desulfurase / selenocysteine lyase